MIEKIISNGDSEAAVAALAVAVKLGLPYVGWTHEQPTPSARYRLERLPGATVGTVIDKAVDTASGSLFFLAGQPASIKLEILKKSVARDNKPLLLVDLVHQRGFSASQAIAGWIVDHRIKILHVDGDGKQPASPEVSAGVGSILEASLFLAMMDTGLASPLPSMVDQARRPPQDLPPDTLAAALDRLEGALSLKDKATIANMAAYELVSLHFTLGDHINRRFALFTTNQALLEACRRHCGRSELAPTDAAAVIIRALWERLRTTCRIRVIK